MRYKTARGNTPLLDGALPGTQQIQGQRGIQSTFQVFEDQYAYPRYDEGYFGPIENERYLLKWINQLKLRLHQQSNSDHSFLRSVDTLSERRPPIRHPHPRFFVHTGLVFLMSFIIISLILFVNIQNLSAKRITPLCSCSLTGLGIVAKGFYTPEGACRYTVRYGKSDRWSDSSYTWDMGNQSSTDLPPSCPQDTGTYVSGNAQDEDCLYATLYIPQSPTVASKLPVFVWLHGGSFMAGSASAPGLDGSNMAVRGDIIVVVLQYRLGVLGFLPPSSSTSSSDPNLGVRDVILALKGLQKGIGFVGGDKDKVTIGGQSSGAGLIRALLGVPSAKGLFRAAILQSDPMSYGFASNYTTSKVREAFYNLEPMKSCTDLKCLQDISWASIIAAQNMLTQAAPLTIQGLPLGMPIRPTHGNPTLPSDPTIALFTAPSQLEICDIPLLITTVSNEAGSALQRLFTEPIPMSNETYFATLSMTVGSTRAAQLSSSSEYFLSDTGGGYGEGGDEFRVTYENAATDGIWRCPNRDVAGQWYLNGGKVWVGEWTKGVTYPDNQVDDGYCRQRGRVCHEDDIFATFGNAPDPSSDVSSLEDDVLSYWISFITNLDPSPINSIGDCPDLSRGWFSWFWPFKREVSVPSIPLPSQTWSPYSSEKHVFAIGGGEVNRCPEGYWGEKVKYDWQIYG
ncbi:uncharacterized protein IL334_002715 [Kwoniella shivajii]|uniref:Carboxylesterase type B domain-containing protein n=1 Tax=Kwoniella shivajii TaxID=564305 RepID=A0ABZ1CYJ9_9TREE|nr:hypothetical protein IL334_002715 [Kwoniella shivajii]